MLTIEHAVSRGIEDLVSIGKGLSGVAAERLNPEPLFDCVPDDPTSPITALYEIVAALRSDIHACPFKENNGASSLRITARPNAVDFLRTCINTPEMKALIFRDVTTEDRKRSLLRRCLAYEDDQDVRRKTELLKNNALSCLSTSPSKGLDLLDSELRISKERAEVLRGDLPALSAEEMQSVVRSVVERLTQ